MKTVKEKTVLEGILEGLQRLFVLILLRRGNLLPWGFHPHSGPLRQRLTNPPKEYGAIMFIVLSYIAAVNGSLSPISTPSLV